MDDLYNLRRFIQAQESVYDAVVSELRNGQKRSHWMWFIFPQLKGLGSSPTAQTYAIASQSEAIAYSEHEILGQRLRECTQLVLNVEGRSADQIFGYPDVLKFCSCMTLFAQAVADKEMFQDAIAKYFDGQPDQATLRLLKQYSP